MALRPTPSLLADIKEKLGWPWVSHLTCNHGKELNKRQPLSKLHDASQTFTEATETKATFLVKQAAGHLGSLQK